MITKMSIPTIQSVVLISLSVLIIVLFLVVSKSYFNSSELNLLVEKAEEHNLEYEVVIHNQLTNSYDFKIFEK